MKKMKRQTKNMKKHFATPQTARISAQRRLELAQALRTGASPRNPKPLDKLLSGLAPVLRAARNSVSLRFY
jgi:hypothetical protein